MENQGRHLISEEIFTLYTTVAVINTFSACCEVQALEFGKDENNSETIDDR